MRPTASLLAILGLGAAGCASNVVNQGYVTTDRDPKTDEGRVVLDDVEVAGLRLSGYAAEDHAGALLDIAGDHDTVQWMACTTVTFVAGGEEIDADASEHDVDSENSPVTMITNHERISVILQDNQLSWLVTRAEERLDLQICATEHKITGAPLQTLRSFAASTLAAHDGRQGMPPLVPPSEGR